LLRRSFFDRRLPDTDYTRKRAGLDDLAVPAEITRLHAVVERWLDERAQRTLDGPT